MKEEEIFQREEMIDLDMIMADVMEIVEEEDSEMISEEEDLIEMIERMVRGELTEADLTTINNNKYQRFQTFSFQIFFFHFDVQNF